MSDVVVVVVVIVVLSSVDIGDPRCPIHGDDAIFTHNLIITKVILNQRHVLDK